jgi:threonine dehydrogenase-like Zn-dependent dehydrogenase
MKAAIFKAAGVPLAIEDIPDPEPGEGEVIIKVGRCGVCGTDLHLTSGHGITLPSGAQLGHEYAGEVVATGPKVTTLKVGDRIAGLPALGCGHCEFCKTGIDLLCRQKKSYGGALAEYARVGERGAVKLPQSVSIADGALIEPLAVGRRALRLARLEEGARVLVIGPGPIGLAVIFWLRRAGVRNITVLASTSRRQALAQAMGADSFVLEGEGAAEEIGRALGGEPDVIFEAAGTPGVLARTIQLIKPQGQIIALGFCLTPDQILPSAALMKDVNIRFSLTYAQEDFIGCAEVLAQDGPQARAMVTDTVSLADFPQAFEALREGRTSGGKLLVDPGLG